jgi:pimeloyl-ACP methyl ester carboxylesterase
MVSQETSNTHLAFPCYQLPRNVGTSCRRCLRSSVYKKSSQGQQQLQETGILSSRASQDSLAAWASSPANLLSLVLLSISSEDAPQSTDNYMCSLLTFIKSIFTKKPPRKPTMKFTPTYASVENEGCKLLYWYQGTGPLITFIPGGNGHGLQYNDLMTLMAPTFTCLTFDRRQMSQSQVEKSKPLSHPQQARDVAAIIKAAGFSKSIIFGSSLGGVIAFQFGIDFPEVVDRMVCHEAPTASLVPNATEIYDALYLCEQLYRTAGLEDAQKEFRKMFKGFDDADLPPSTNRSDPRNEPSFWEYEFWTASMYTPDLRKLVKNKTRVAVMAGERSGDDWFSVATKEQAKILGCERCLVPGHHGGFEAETDLFLPHLLSLLERLEDKKMNLQQ